jgi:hypothetical protein
MRIIHAHCRQRTLSYAIQLRHQHQTRAVRTWEKNGLAVVGRLPEAFHHPTQGYADALVMYRRL